MKKFLIILIPIFVSILAAYGGFEGRQVAAVGILALFISSTLLYWEFRFAFALMGVSILFTLGLLDAQNFILFAQLDVIIFLVGMMAVIGVLEERHFFDYILDIIGQKIRSGFILFVFILLVSAVMAALVDEVTSIIFITLFIMNISKALHIDPIPLILSSIFATNVGSSATVVGNPIGIIVALRGGFTFGDFLVWSAPNALIILLVTVFLCVLLWKNYLKEMDQKLKFSPLKFDIPDEVRKAQFINLLIFGGTILMLILHHPIEHLLENLFSKEEGAMKNAMLIATPLFWSSVGLLLERKRAREIMLHRVDWITLIFFTLLFSAVGALKYTGAGYKMGEYIISFGSLIGKILGSSEFGTLFSIFLFQGVLTAFLDNVLAIAVLIPVVFSIYETHGWNIFSFFWALLFSGTMAGNFTPIGSTANIIALGMIEKQGKKITIGYWLRYSSVIATVQVLISLFWLFLFVVQKAPDFYVPPIIR